MLSLYMRGSDMADRAAPDCWLVAGFLAGLKMRGGLLTNPLVDSLRMWSR